MQSSIHTPRSPEEQFYRGSNAPSVPAKIVLTPYPTGSEYYNRESIEKWRLQAHSVVNSGSGSFWLSTRVTPELTAQATHGDVLAQRALQWGNTLYQAILIAVPETENGFIVLRQSLTQTAYANGSGSPCGNAAYVVLASRRIASSRPEAYQSRLLSQVLKALTTQLPDDLTPWEFMDRMGEISRTLQKLHDHPFTPQQRLNYLLTTAPPGHRDRWQRTVDKVKRENPHVLVRMPDGSEGITYFEIFQTAIEALLQGDADQIFFRDSVDRQT